MGPALGTIRIRYVTGGDPSGVEGGDGGVEAQSMLPAMSSGSVTANVSQVRVSGSAVDWLAQGDVNVVEGALAGLGTTRPSTTRSGTCASTTRSVT